MQFADNWLWQLLPLSFPKISVSLFAATFVQDSIFVAFCCHSIKKKTFSLAPTFAPLSSFFPLTFLSIDAFVLSSYIGRGVTTAFFAVKKGLDPLLFSPQLFWRINSVAVLSLLFSPRFREEKCWAIHSRINFFILLPWMLLVLLLASLTQISWSSIFCVQSENHNRKDRKELCCTRGSLPFFGTTSASFFLISVWVMLQIGFLIHLAPVPLPKDRMFQIHRTPLSSSPPRKFELDACLPFEFPLPVRGPSLMCPFSKIDSSTIVWWHPQSSPLPFPSYPSFRV